MRDILGNICFSTCGGSLPVNSSNEHGSLQHISFPEQTGEKEKLYGHYMPKLHSFREELEENWSFPPDITL